MAGVGDILGGFGSGLGGLEGENETKEEKYAILKALADQRKAAAGLDPSKLSGSGFDKISTDPRTRQAQMGALDNMTKLGGAGGWDPQALAMNAQAQREAAGYEQSQRGALEQNLAAKGAGGSGAEIAGLLAGQQGGANRVAASGEQAAADARKRALDAMAGAGQLGGQIHAQDYGEAANRAKADDAARMNVWNAGMQKYGAQRDAQHDQTSAWAADRAATIARTTAAGKAIGGGIGGVGDMALGAATGTPSLPKGVDQRGLDSMNPATIPNEAPKEDQWWNNWGG